MSIIRIFANVLGGWILCVHFPFPFPLSAKLRPDPPIRPAQHILPVVNEWDLVLVQDAVNPLAEQQRLAPG